jgi:chromate transporter
MNAPPPTTSVEPTHELPSYTLRQLVLYFLKLGTLGFGGPVALAGYMHRDLVDARQWITDGDYKEGLSLAQLAPGPLAAQLAIYLGYVHYRIVGATLVGIAFVLPSFLMVLALGWAYVRFGGLTWMQSVFYGVGAAVIGIIAISAYKLTKKSVGKDKLLWLIYLVLVAVTVITESEVAWLFLAAGVLVWLCRAPPKWLRQGRLNAFAAAPLTTASGMMSAIDWPLLTQIAVFFAKAGAFVFGSGLAIVPFLYGGVVTEHHWLNDKQFVDAVAVAMITPGPVVITVGFIGYLVAGFPGACVAAAATFLPCYLFTVLPAPYFKKYGKLPAILAFVDGVTAAAIGAITGAVIVLAKRSIVDIPTGLLALVTVALLLKFKKLSEPMIVAGAALITMMFTPDRVCRCRLSGTPCNIDCRRIISIELRRFVSRHSSAAVDTVDALSGHLRTRCGRFYGFAPKSAPMEAVTPSASAPQKATRRAPRANDAPPARAPTAPSNASNTSVATVRVIARLSRGTMPTISTGTTAPARNAAADAKAACTGFAASSCVIPSSSRRWAPIGSRAMSWSATRVASSGSRPRP